MSQSASAKRYVGIQGSARAWLLARLQRETPMLVVVCPDRRSGEDLATDLGFFLAGVPVLHLPAWETLPFELVSPQTETSALRLRAFEALMRGEPAVVIVPADALAQKVLPREQISRRTFTLQPMQPASVGDIATRLRSAGFQEVALVEEVGHLAVRGQVVDFFPSTRDEPVRVEVDEGAISRLRSFDPDSQRTTADLAGITILPVRELVRLAPGEELGAAIERVKLRGKKLETPPREIARVMSALRTGADFPGAELVEVIGLDHLDTIFELLPPEAGVAICGELDVRHTLEEFEALVGERERRMAGEHFLIPERISLYLPAVDVVGRLNERVTAFIEQVEILGDSAAATPPENIRTFSNLELATRLRSNVGSGRALQPLREKLELWRQYGYHIAFVTGSRQRGDRLQSLLLEIGFDASRSSRSGNEWIDAPHREPLVILQGHLTHGFQLPREKLVFIAETEVFAERSSRRGRGRRTSLKKILGTLSQLAEGDHIVHIDYGIGRYHGLKHLEIEEAEGDFLHIEYADSRLYLPVQNIGRIQKFTAADGQTPILDKLGSTRWVKTRQKVHDAVVSLAGDLIKLYAERSVTPGWRYEPYGAEDERFAEGFAWDETPDQWGAIEETLKDMAAGKPMDRLVCGDVGFGKTEVAIRAAFKCVQHTRQVAVLVPTTILVEQHRASFAERFRGWPVEVGAVSRFYTPQQNRETLARLASGELDIVVGTHRLLSRDVVFKDLGLLIVDEEHRFGVKQKERLKQLKRQVDVLSLTATPIPRTMHMSLLGIRDISVIATPPQNRKVIRTYIAAHTDTIIRDAILRELQRGGQCFFLHNRIESIDLITAHLAELVPEARFDFGHGQMGEQQLEEIMRRFLNRETDVLVSTTIIESGLDIPNANTIIVERADTFGLAQLYQLRGRVGRSNRQAYAYFLVPPGRKLGLDAQRRLNALQSLDDLGIGFNLAMRDLEIRGAGNLLGKEQSGNVLSVGFDLYTKILKEAVLHLKGEEPAIEEVVDPEVKLGVSAFIPDHYIPDISERLVLYQRLAAIFDDDEARDLAAEMEDRFGPPGPEAERLLELMAYRALLRHYGVLKAEFTAGRLRLTFSPRARIDATRVIELVQRHKDRFKFTKNLTLTAELEVREIERPAELHQLTRDLLESISPRSNTGTATSPP